MLVITRMSLLTGNYGALGQKVIHNHCLLVAIFTSIDKAAATVMMMLMVVSVVSWRLTSVVTIHHVVCGRHR